jgi:CheY-like chemotaxis protein
VLINLGSNAAHAQREGGRIEIELRRAVLDAAAVGGREGLEAGPHAALVVRDHGTGMDEETVQRMFEPFFTTKPLGQGTGLGLAVVHGIVHSHGGEIAVESATGRGTCITIHLPLVEAPAAASELPMDHGADEPGSGRGERILLVDDEPGVANTRGVLLKRLGYEVTVHYDPLEALSEFRRHPDAFDLVLTDHMMPGLDGLQLADAILEVRPSLAILLTSGNALAFTTEDVLQRNLRGLLPKPSTAQELSRAVRQALGAAVA